MKPKKRWNFIDKEFIIFENNKAEYITYNKNLESKKKLMKNYKNKTLNMYSFGKNQKNYNNYKNQKNQKNYKNKFQSWKIMKNYNNTKCNNKLNKKKRLYISFSI